eukprot:scaffold670127_cov45-Prasinocladus_malaysianus.AAC.1
MVMIDKFTRNEPFVDEAKLAALLRYSAARALGRNIIFCKHSIGQFGWAAACLCTFWARQRCLAEALTLPTGDEP